MVKFLKCVNPSVSHIKMVYGDLLNDWVNHKCDCGYNFEGFVELSVELLPDNLPAFKDVNPEDDTKILPVIKVLDKP